MSCFSYHGQANTFRGSKTWSWCCSWETATSFCFLFYSELQSQLIWRGTTADHRPHHLSSWWWGQGKPRLTFISQVELEGITFKWVTAVLLQCPSVPPAQGRGVFAGDSVENCWPDSSFPFMRRHMQVLPGFCPSLSVFFLPVLLIPRRAAAMQLQGADGGVSAPTEVELLVSFPASQ